MSAQEETQEENRATARAKTVAKYAGRARAEAENVEKRRVKDTRIAKNAQEAQQQRKNNFGKFTPAEIFQMSPAERQALFDEARKSIEEDIDLEGKTYAQLFGQTNTASPEEMSLPGEPEQDDSENSAETAPRQVDRYSAEEPASARPSDIANDRALENAKPEYYYDPVPYTDADIFWESEEGDIGCAELTQQLAQQIDLDKLAQRIVQYVAKAVLNQQNRKDSPVSNEHVNDFSEDQEFSEDEEMGCDDCDSYDGYDDNGDWTEIDEFESEYVYDEDNGGYIEKSEWEDLHNRRYQGIWWD